MIAKKKSLIEAHIQMLDVCLTFGVQLKLGSYLFGGFGGLGLGPRAPPRLLVSVLGLLGLEVCVRQPFWDVVKVDIIYRTPYLMYMCIIYN